MVKAIKTIILLAFLALFMSCERMPLYDMEKSMYLDLKLNLKLDLDLDVELTTDVDIKIDSVIKMPAHNKVLFYSTENNELKHTEFVDSTGGDIFTPPGLYNMLVYSFGTEYTQIRGESNIETIEAYTSDITDTKTRLLNSITRQSKEESQGPIIYAPDHLLVANEEIIIPEFSEDTIVITADASTIVKTYSFAVTNIKGCENISSCEAFVTNQARTCFFGRGEISNEPATICFPVGVNHTKDVLYTTFNTFGKLPGESRAYLHIVIVDTGGKEHYVSEDITEQFENGDHRIVIDKEIDIPEPESQSSGIAPTVEEWDEEITDVPLG